MDNNYNGWTNRETWLVSLWFGDSIEPNMGPLAICDMVEAYVDETAGSAGFIRDMMNMSAVNWQELADNYAEK